eukprot:1594898-Amphidinium_carterae.1
MQGTTNDDRPPTSTVDRRRITDAGDGRRAKDDGRRTTDDGKFQSSMLAATNIILLISNRDSKTTLTLTSHSTIAIHANTNPSR